MTVTKADGKKVMMKCDQSETSMGSVKLERNSNITPIYQAMKTSAAKFNNSREINDKTLLRTITHI